MIGFFSALAVIAGFALIALSVIGMFRRMGASKGRSIYRFMLGVVVLSVGFGLERIVTFRDAQMAHLYKALEGLPDFYLIVVVALIVAVQVAVLVLAIGVVLRAFFRTPPPLRWFRRTRPDTAPGGSMDVAP